MAILKAKPTGIRTLKLVKTEDKKGTRHDYIQLTWLVVGTSPEFFIFDFVINNTPRAGTLMRFLASEDETELDLDACIGCCIEAMLTTSEVCVGATIVWQTDIKYYGRFKG